MLGRGASGVVYAAIDRETGGEVALKTFSERDPEALYRLKQEFRACAGVRHRNLVELYELQVDEHDCFFTMELVQGVDFVHHLRGGLADGASPSLIRFLAGAEQLVQGVAALHAAGRLHRDVKPPNALVTTAGRVVLLDFGFTVGFGERALAVERSDGIAGSLAYMAPEILWGRLAGPASDWYSVGVVFYEALSGRLPFAASSAQRVGGTAARSSAEQVAMKRAIAGASGRCSGSGDSRASISSRRIAGTPASGGACGRPSPTRCAEEAAKGRRPLKAS